MADKRKLLKKGEVIRLCSDDKKTVVNFTVTKKYSADEEKISYLGEAGRKKYILTELYPLCDGAPLMIRGEDNGLFMPCEKKGIRSLTKKEAAELTEKFTLLKKYKRSAKAKSEFSHVIPDFEILRGCDKDSKPTGGAYILWEMPVGDWVGTDKLSKTLKTTAAKNPEKSVFTLLLTFYTLAGALELLHSGGFSLGGKGLDKALVSVKNGSFRVETLRLSHTDTLIVKREDAEDEFQAAVQADISSFGLALFNAVLEKDEIPGGKYSDECRSLLKEILSSARLFSYSPVTSNYKMLGLIEGILGDALDGQSPDEGSISDRLKSAAVFILPSEYSESTNLYRELKGIDKKLDKYNEADSLFAIKSLLFNYPLYLADKDNTIKITVVGFGVYSQSFLDIALTTGQMHGKKLDVTVVTLLKDAYKQEYLSARPELADFFDIDREDESEGNYGKITFVEPAEADERFRNGFSADSPKLNRELIEALCRDEMPGYVFVSAGSPELNKRVAKAYMKYTEEHSHKCIVSFVYPEKLRADERHKNLIPVNVNAKSRETLRFDEIERMAFNLFLLWYKSFNLNVDFGEAEKKFKRAYDYKSSVSCALSIKYKLYSLGIELKGFSSAELLATARTYADTLRREKQIFAGLVEAEHRRWVTEKLIDGYKCRKDLSVCLTDGTQNKRLKEHVCIVKSRGDFLLSEKYTTDEAWVTPCETDDELDALDRMSLELHRLFREKAAEKINTFTLHSVQESNIKSLIKDNKSAALAFNELMECLDEIWEFSLAAYRKYDGLKEKFLGELREMPDDVRALTETEFNYIDANAQPVIRACVKRIYKNSDTDIINHLPFVLTYKKDISVMVPLQTGSTTDIFNNIAHISVINPSEVIYVFYADTEDAVKDAENAVRGFVPYFKKNNLRARVKLIAACTSASEKFNKRVGDALQKLKEEDESGAIAETHVISLSSVAQLAPALRAQYGALDLYERNKSFLSAYLWGAGFYDECPSFSFNSAKREFKANAKAAWITYIGGTQFLDIDDMFAINGSRRISEGKRLTTAEHKALWDIYSKGRWAWKALCDMLDEYRKNDAVAQFNSDHKDSSVKEFVSIVPVECRDGYRRIISVLSEDHNIFEKGSRVEYNSIDSCRITISASSKFAKEIEKLFAVPEKFVTEKNILFKVKDSVVGVACNDLSVRSCVIPTGKHHKEICDILRKLDAQHFISNLSFEDNNATVSFRYSERQIKDILTCAGRILEQFIYNKLKNGSFDDVECDYEISWGDSGDFDIRSEMDCIVTKGFASCIIEAKATAELSQDYYYKIAALASRFGVNTVPVIVASDLVRDGFIYRSNKVQIERGRQLGVITVFMPGEIDNIDKTIEYILSGRYAQKELMPK